MANGKGQRANGKWCVNGQKTKSPNGDLVDDIVLF